MPSVKQWLFECPLDKVDARVLLQFVLKLSRAQLLIREQEEIRPEDLCRLSELVERRLKGEPVPYLTGEQEFYSRSFKVNPSVLIPRPDTESLVEWLIEKVPANSNVLDLGTGSGAIAVTLSLERKDCKVYASDISSKALEVAKENALNLSADVTFFRSDWLTDIPSNISFDAFVSNPPYIRPNDEHLINLQFEPQGALTDGNDGLSCYRTILSQIKQRKEPPKLIAFEHGWDQGCDVRKIFSQYGFTGAQTVKDLGNNDRFTFWVSAVG